MARRKRRFWGCNELNMPAATVSSAPGSSGMAPRSISTSTREGFIISTICPSRPKPVTSVHAVAPCLNKHLAASRFDCTMLSSAAAIHGPFALCCISAANRVPVPMALVNRSRSPATRPPLCRICSRSIRPFTEKPKDNSSPSLVCPPTSAVPVSFNTLSAPCSICASKSSTFFSPA